MAERKEKAPRSKTMALRPVGAASRARKGQGQGTAVARNPPQRDRARVQRLSSPDATPGGLSAKEAAALFMEAYAQSGSFPIEPVPMGSLEELLQRENEESPSQFQLRREVTRALAKERGDKTPESLIAEGHKMVNAARYGVRY